MFYYVLRKTQEFVSDSWEISLISANIYYIGGPKCLILLLFLALKWPVLGLCLRHIHCGQSMMLFFEPKTASLTVQIVN